MCGCVCVSVFAGDDLISGVCLCSRNPAAHLPICPSLSALVAPDESPISLWHVITGLLFSFMETDLSQWYLARLLKTQHMHTAAKS